MAAAAHSGVKASMSGPEIVTDVASGLQKVVLRTEKGETAEIYLHGAHLNSWKSATGEERLFVSRKALYQPPKAIRGGVPVCFPQFGQLGALGQHGFARNTSFEVESGSPWGVTLLLRSPGTEAAAYPHPFDLRVTVELCEGRLEQTLTATNTGAAPMAFTGALHTYFRVRDISQAMVVGLQGCRYQDSLKGKAESTEEQPAVPFAEEVDRVYVGVPRDLEIRDAAAGTAVSLQLHNFPDAVVWNPWVEKAKAMADFGDDEYREMVCVEPAVAASGPVVLQPGEAWSGKQVLCCKELSR